MLIKICRGTAAAMHGSAVLIRVSATAALCVMVAALATPAQAAALPGASVSTNPADFTPQVMGGSSTVRQLVQCGAMMYAVGTFSSVAAPGHAAVSRNNVFSFNASTGAISSWNPNANGTVYSVAVNSNCSNAYIGGTFKTVHGTSMPYLAKIDTTTGAVVTAWAPRPNSSVLGVAIGNNQVFAGGYFTKIGGGSRSFLATLSAGPGALTSYSTLAVSGQVQGTSPAALQTYRLVMNPAANRLLVVGAFTRVNGQTRMQAFIADLGSTSVTLDSWYAPGLTGGCSANFAWFVRAGNWSPDGGHIYLATTGVKGKSPYCDTVAQFSSASNGNTKEDWINKTGCDSLYAVAADATSVYIGGHERWMSNPNGCDSKGPGALDRPGVGAVQTANGQATSWNPTRDRGHGADWAIRTSAGLWVASDTYYNSVRCGGEYHPGICFFPNA